jgi:hypothetical protein
MGCACLRGGGHHWPDRGAGRVAARQRRQQVQLAGQPGPVLAAARFEHLRRPRGDADTVRLGVAKDECDADPNAVPHPNAVGFGQPIGDRDRQRVTDAMPIAVGLGDAITFCDSVPVTERERETVGLALGPL